jgi:methyl-accepting chemotaxis protein
MFTMLLKGIREMPALLWFSDQEIKDLNATLKRIEDKIDQLILSASQELERDMAEKDEIANLVAQVQANKSASDSAKLAFDGFVQQVSELTQQLQDAVANNTDVSPDIKAAADALAANTEELRAAIPTVVQAIQANVTT